MVHSKHSPSHTDARVSPKDTLTYGPGEDFIVWSVCGNTDVTSSLFSSPPQLPAVAMPASLLWAVDVYGRIYGLSTAGQQWELCRDTQMEFKRVTAAQQCCWGIACDNNIYLKVHASDLPIRFQEETYENQVCC